MELVTVRELFKNREQYLDKKVTVGGWIRSIRDSKTFGFIVVNDGSYFEPLQVVYHDKMENFDEISRQNVGAAIIVTGTLVATPQAKQPFEIQADEVTVEGASAPDYPLQKKRHSFEYLRTISHLRPRTNTFQAVFRVRSMIAYAIHQFFQERGFVYVHTPLITGSDCEGAGEMFQVTTLDLKDVPKSADGSIDYSKDFFGKETNLTVSGQLNGETFAQAFRSIYTFGPTFRAENSNTTRHAAEFWMIEPEIAFADLEDNMDLAESMLKYVISYVLENAPEEMNFFNSFVDKGLLDRLNNVVNSDFARVTYTEAVDILMKNNDKFEYKVSWGTDLQTEHERYHLFESIDTLKEAVATLTKHCITGITANKGQCEEYIEKSVGISTALCPYIGYAKSAEIAKKSLKTGISVKELVLEEGLLKEEELKEILKPEKMTQPMREKVMKAVS